MSADDNSDDWGWSEKGDDVKDVDNENYCTIFLIL